MRRYFRKLVILAAASSLVLLPVGNASADPVTVQHLGCNFATCVQSESYVGGLYVATAYWIPAAGGYGHFHIWGPGLDRNTMDKEWVSNERTPRMGGAGVGTVCAQFWHKVGENQYTPGWGLPCVPTH